MMSSKYDRYYPLVKLIYSNLDSFKEHLDFSNYMCLHIMLAQIVII